MKIGYMPRQISSTLEHRNILNREKRGATLFSYLSRLSLTRMITTTETDPFNVGRRVPLQLVLDPVYPCPAPPLKTKKPKTTLIPKMVKTHSIKIAVNGHTLGVSSVRTPPHTLKRGAYSLRVARDSL